MRRIQIVLDVELIDAADRVARRLHISRSALVRDALRAYLRRFSIQELEKQDREGYERHPDSEDELQGWEEVAAWPSN